MDASKKLSITVWMLTGWTVLLTTLPSACADDQVTAVYSKVVSKDCIRTKLPDGSFKPETHFLKNGGR